MVQEACKTQMTTHLTQSKTLLTCSPHSDLQVPIWTGLLVPCLHVLCSLLFYITITTPFLTLSGTYQELTHFRASEIPSSRSVHLQDNTCVAFSLSLAFPSLSTSQSKILTLSIQYILGLKDFLTYNRSSINIFDWMYEGTLISINLINHSERLGGECGQYTWSRGPHNTCRELPRKGIPARFPYGWN